MSTIGLNRLRGSVAELLSEAADTCVQSAVGLQWLAQSGHHGERQTELVRIAAREAVAARRHRKLVEELQQSMRLGPDRGAIFALAVGINEMTEQLGTLARLDIDDIGADRRVEVTGVLRDLARTSALAIRDLDAATPIQEHRWDHARRLLKEGRRLTGMLAAESLALDDPLGVLRAQQWIRAARSALDLAAGTLRRLQIVALTRPEIAIFNRAFNARQRSFARAGP